VRASHEVRYFTLGGVIPAACLFLQHCKVCPFSVLPSTLTVMQLFDGPGPSLFVCPLIRLLVLPFSSGLFKQTVLSPASVPLRLQTGFYLQSLRPDLRPAPICGAMAPSLMSLRLSFALLRTDDVPG
jgi:hypothetical protein